MPYFNLYSQNFYSLGQSADSYNKKEWRGWKIRHKYTLTIKERNVSADIRYIKMKEEWKEFLKEVFIKYKYIT